MFITKNGKGDLAVMSIEVYERIAGRYELYALLEEGLADIREGRTQPLGEGFAEKKASISK